MSTSLSSPPPAVAARPAVSPATTQAQVLVDLAAVAANTRLLAARAGRELVAVVKADGFGHGALDVARTALVSGATSLGVTSVAEALELRDAGIAAPVLSWLNPVAADFESALRADVDLAVPSEQHLAAVAEAAALARRTAQVHLQVDVGMSRDGCEPRRWRRLCLLARDAERRGLVRVVGVMGHLGCADRPGDPANRAGTRTFAAAAITAQRAGLRPRVRHLAATAATLTDPRTRFDGSRVGAGLVGIDPTGTVRLHPAMTLTAPVVDVRSVPAGVRIGYGRGHVTSRPTTLALLPLGYADGLPRAASGRAEVWLRGRRRRVVGVVSMDQVVLDTEGDHVVRGEVATVFGPGRHGEPTAAEWAGWSGTLEHEIVTGLGRRVGRAVTTATGVPS
jgi:alanine racemase